MPPVSGGHSAIEERGLILAMLRARMAAAQRLAAADPTKADSVLHDRARQLAVLIEDIEARLHLP